MLTAVLLFDRNGDVIVYVCVCAGQTHAVAIRARKGNTTAVTTGTEASDNAIRISSCYSPYYASDIQVESLVGFIERRKTLLLQPVKGFSSRLLRVLTSA